MQAQPRALQPSFRYPLCTINKSISSNQPASQQHTSCRGGQRLLHGEKSSADDHDDDELPAAEIGRATVPPVCRADGVRPVAVRRARSTAMCRFAARAFCCYCRGFEWRRA